VRNCGDGSVEAQVEGEASAVQQLIRLIGEGPPAARVDSVSEQDSKPQGLAVFEVRD
jgi:acylphosphatase